MLDRLAVGLSGLCLVHNPMIIAAGAVGVLLLVVGGTIAHARYGIVADRVLTIGGSLLLAATHYANSRYARHRAPDVVNS